MSLPKPRFTGIFIPVEILEIEELTILEQMLISWIDALYSEEHGGCFASNIYLAEKLRVKENTIAKAMTHLRKIGILEDVSFDGRHRIIRAKIGDFTEKSQSKAGLDLNPKQSWIKIQGSIGQKSSRSLIEKKEESKVYKPPTPKGEDGGVTSLSSSNQPKTKESPCPKERYLENVLLTNEEYTKLMTLHGEKDLQRMLEILDSYIGSVGKNYKSHYHVLTKANWVYTRLNEEKAKNITPQGSNSLEENKNHAQKIASKFNDQQKQFHIDVLREGIEINALKANMQPICLKYSEKGFKDQLENAMRKLGLH